MLLAKNGFVKSKKIATPTNALLLIHYDSDFTDSRGHSVTLTNSPSINTSTTKFGNGSGQFNSNSAIQFNSTDFLFNGDFTFETWIRFTSFPPTKRVIFNSCISQATGAWGLNINTDGTINLDQFGFGNWLNTPTAIVDSIFHHITFTRNSGTIRVFIDGILQGIFNNTDVIGTSDGITIGSRGGSISSEGITALLDETLITNIGKYTSNFTPSTSPYI